MSYSTRCAACKSLRRRCPQDCVLAPYFPSNNPQRFAQVHKIFGAGNVTKMLQQLPVQLRAEAADCMAFEAYSRIQDPVYGCVGLIFQLQQQIIGAQSEIVKIKGEIAMHNARQQQQTEIGAGDSSWQMMFNSSRRRHHHHNQDNSFQTFQTLSNNNNNPTIN